MMASSQGLEVRNIPRVWLSRGQECQNKQMFSVEADITARNRFINQLINYVPDTVLSLHRFWSVMLSALVNFVPHGLLLWAVTAGLTTDSQHPGSQVWIHRTWGSKDREARSKNRFGNSEVCLTQGQGPMFQFHLYSMLQMRSPGHRPV